MYPNKDTNKNTDSLLKKVQKNYVGKQTLIVKKTKKNIKVSSIITEVILP
jgi:hypothetical protein